MTNYVPWTRNVPVPIPDDMITGTSQVLIHPIPCPDCGSHLTLRKNGAGYWYRCIKCDGNVSADPLGRPLGTPIDAAGRKKRAEAHALLDPLWLQTHGNDLQSKYAVRNLIYEYLGLFFEDFHIGKLNHEELDRLLEILRNGTVQRYIKFGLGIDIQEVDNDIERQID